MKIVQFIEKSNLQKSMERIVSIPLNILNSYLILNSIKFKLQLIK